ncbi:MAG: hypothetical protein JSW50_14755 [Candidatus Latescibacterota bacterium]|nr:MAG: hypothetical protein JSW50_14755 [Candidatus Latescibacterota bacterium]
MAKTLVEKVDSPVLDVTIFKISGTLGYHENKVLTKFFDECSGRGINKLILDLTDLGSLGGGCAKIIRDAASTGKASLCIAGASKTVQAFLEKRGPTSIRFAANTDDALADMAAGTPASKSSPDLTSSDDGAPDELDRSGSETVSENANREIRVDDVIDDVSEVLRKSPRPIPAHSSPSNHKTNLDQPSAPAAADRVSESVVDAPGTVASGTTAGQTALGTTPPTGGPKSPPAEGPATAVGSTPAGTPAGGPATAVE